MAKNWLGYILGNFFANSSGHPGWNPFVIESNKIERALIRKRPSPTNDRVARWFVFKPKIQIWVNFGGSAIGRCWYILWTLGPF
jgi:hypothetical protein